MLRRGFKLDFSNYFKSVKEKKRKKPSAKKGRRVLKKKLQEEETLWVFLRKAEIRRAIPGG